MFWKGRVTGLIMHCNARLQSSFWQDLVVLIAISAETLQTLRDLSLN